MALTPVPDLGSFTRRNKEVIDANFAAVTQPDIWVRPQAAIPGADGTYARPYGSVTAVVPKMVPGMVIGVLGVLVEECSMPTGVNDVTIVGMANQPRQATTSSVANGGGATWLSPSGGTGALITLNGQATTIRNIFMNCSSSTNPCVLLTNTGDGPALANAEHTVLDGCIFTGAKYGVRATGQPNWVTVRNSKFFGFGDSGDLAMSSTVGAGTGTLLGWEISKNQFLSNAGHITIPLSSGEIFGNRFAYIWGAVTATTQVVLTSGANNSVHDNHFDIPYATNGLTAMFAGGTNDRWGPNQFSDAVATTIFSYGVPSS